MYKIGITKEASKFLARLEPLFRERIYEKISLLKYGLFDKLDIKPLQGKEGLYRMRIGDFRVIYKREDELFHILVVKIGNRGDIYKKI